MALPPARTLSTALAAVWLAGCTWISDADVEALKGQVDDDGDGFPKSEDCNDADPAISPGAAEVWYTGIDDDCQGGDDFDQDLDGYVADENAGKITEGVSGTGALPPGDCDDSTASARPGLADAWYDGVDSDCSGDDDYDQDVDGYVADAYAGLATEYVSGSGALPGDDCDDLRAEVNPAATDIWYDGEDRDCSGNDDFDRDGDGWVPADFEGVATEYLNEVGTLPGGDCNDDPAATPSGAAVYPGASDDWYDGVDADCGLDDDYDQDLDGYVLTEDEGKTTAGVEGSGALPSGDCDDGDAEAFPGQVEILGDAQDRDCDGGADSFPVLGVEEWSGEIESFTWTNPHDLRISANSSRVYIALAMDGGRYEKLTGSALNYYASAIAFGLDVTAPDEGIVSVVDWWRNVSSPSFDLTDGHDFIATDEALYGVVGLQLSDRRALRMGGWDLDAGSRFGAKYEVSAAGGSADPFEDIAMAQDGEGNLHALGCESSTQRGQYAMSAPAALRSNLLDESGEFELRADVCALGFADDPTAALYTGDGTQRVDFTYDRSLLPPSLTLADSSSSSRPRDIAVVPTAEGDWVVVADSATSAIRVLAPDGSSSALPAGGSPAQVMGLEHPLTGDLVLAWTNSSGEATYGWGNPDAGFDTYDLEVDFAVTEAGIWVDPTGEELMVVALGTEKVALGLALLP